MHGCQLQTMNDLELIKNQKHKPIKPFIAKNDKEDFYIRLASKLILQTWFMCKSDAFVDETAHLNFVKENIVFV